MGFYIAKVVKNKFVVVFYIAKVTKNKFVVTLNIAKVMPKHLKYRKPTSRAGFFV